MQVLQPKVQNIIKIIISKYYINIFFSAFINSVSANGYQIVVSANKPVLQQNIAISTIQVNYSVFNVIWFYINIFAKL